MQIIARRLAFGRGERGVRQALRMVHRLAVLLMGWCFLQTCCLAETARYEPVEAIFNAHCLDCHGTKDAEGQLVLESFETLMKGGEMGPSVLSGKSSDSLLIQMVEGSFKKEGKTKIMPPGKRKKLTAQEIASIRAWIDAGAPAPEARAQRELVVPKILPKGAARNPIQSLAFSGSTKVLALARYAKVELRNGEKLALIRTLDGPVGNVNAVVFSSDGRELFGAGGQAGVGGEIRQWRTADGELIRVISGHQDAIYSIALSPDGKTLATGSYDQKIKLWNVEDGKEIKTISGHNGCVYRLAFRQDGKVLASASADRTVKLWEVATGARRDTLSQATKELFTVAWSPNGRRLSAGGADNRIRIWEVSEAANETTNPMLHSKFGHEGAILNLVFSADGKTMVSSADDRTIKVWDAVSLKEKLLLEAQPDWPAALAMIDDKMVAVGRLDGSVALYDLATGHLTASVQAPASPANSKTASQTDSTQVSSATQRD